MAEFTKLRPEVVNIPKHHRGLNRVSFFNPPQESFWLAIGTSLIESLLRFRNIPDCTDSIFNALQRQIGFSQNLANRYNFHAEHQAFMNLVGQIRQFSVTGNHAQFTVLMETRPDIARTLLSGIKLIVAHIEQTHHVSDHVMRGSPFRYEDIQRFIVGLCNSLDINTLVVFSDGKHRMIQNSSETNSILLCLYTDRERFGVLYNDEMIRISNGGDLRAEQFNSFPFFHKNSRTITGPTPPNVKIRWLGKQLLNKWNDKINHSYEKHFGVYHNTHANRRDRDHPVPQPPLPVLPRYDPNQPINPIGYNPPQVIQAVKIDCGKCGANNTETHIICQDHAICDNCRARTLLFGYTSCFMCRTPYSEQTMRILTGQIRQRFNYETVPLSQFKCKECKTIKPFSQYRPVDCECPVCVDCEFRCSCDVEVTNEEYKCPICHKRLLDVFETPCRHMYCWKCAHTWFTFSSSCPRDQKIVEISQIKRAEAFQKIMDEELKDAPRLPTLKMPSIRQHVQQMTNEDFFIEALAFKILNPQQGFGCIEEQVRNYIPEMPQQYAGSLQRLHHNAQWANYLSQYKQCDHPKLLYTFDCGKEHCLYCVKYFFAEWAAEHQFLWMCDCGVPLSDRNQQQIGQI